MLFFNVGIVFSVVQHAFASSRLRRRVSAARTGQMNDTRAQLQIEQYGEQNRGRVLQSFAR